MEDPLITEEDFADQVGWSLDWARKQRRAGNGPEFIRLGAGNGTIRYRQSAVDRWLETRTHDSGAEVEAEQLPDHLLAGIDRWIRHAIRPGAFLWAVIRNDLADAIRRADDVASIMPLVSHLTEHAPSASWGSTERVRSWKGDPTWSPHSFEEATAETSAIERWVLSHHSFKEVWTEPGGKRVEIRLNDGRSASDTSRDLAFRRARYILEDLP